MWDGGTVASPSPVQTDEAFNKSAVKKTPSKIFNEWKNNYKEKI
jgi:hypothetical protein